MGWKSSFTLAARILACGIFGLSGAGKLISPEPGALSLVHSFDFGYEVALQFTLSLATVELLVLCGIVIPRFGRWFAPLLGAIFGVGFTAFALYRILIGDNSPCGCFGALLPELHNSARLAMTLLLLFCSLLIAFECRTVRTENSAL
jgi:uncharacterized membrane protein YphA (DoxX/SURF4 family)